jgi:hypothetical protein
LDPDSGQKSLVTTGIPNIDKMPPIEGGGGGGGGRFDSEEEDKSSEQSAPGVSEFKDDDADGFADISRRNKSPAAAIPRKPSGGAADFNGRPGSTAAAAAKAAVTTKQPGKSSVPSRKVIMAVD